MKKDYRVILRMVCVLVLLGAVAVVLIRKGVISRFWEQTDETVQTIDISEEERLEQEKKKAELEQQRLAMEREKQEEQRRLEEERLQEEKRLEEERLAELAKQEQTPEERLAEYLKEDPRTPVEAKGIYITGPVAGTANTMPDLTDFLQQTELNAMVIDVKNDSGEVTYKMGLPLAQEIDAERNYVGDMQALVQELKEKDIYLIARIVAFKDPILAENKPEFAVKNADGTVFHDNSGLAWVNPYKQEVWDYLIELGKQAAALGFDEIQFDYIRFSTAKGIAEADFGTEAERMTKQDAICGFLGSAYEQLAPLGVYVSADVFGTIIPNKTDGELIGQDYVEMAKRCDYICPMVYPSHYAVNAYGLEVPDAAPHELIEAAIADGEKLLAEAADENEVHIAKQRPWLQAFTATWVDGHISYRGKELRAQIDGCADAGVGEWLLWNAANNYSNYKDGLLDN
ncbi:MAG: putative glycoside hydrolase [bacterium]|nr:putative glycoside hydrolase [bacterium]